MTEHPLLTLLQRVNPVHNNFDLLELTQTYLEVHGKAFWYVPRDPLGVPEEIWILPAQNVTPKRRPGSRNVVDFYEYRNGRDAQTFAADRRHLLPLSRSARSVSGWLVAAQGLL